VDGGVADFTVVLQEPDLGRLQAVFNIYVAVGTVHLSFGHVGIVHEGYIFIFRQPVGLIVAGITAVLGGFSLSLDDVPVALFAGDVAGPDKIQMVKSESLELNVLLGNLVTGGAIPQGKRTDLPFDGLQMAEVAGAICHLYVGAYHDLAVAARATELFAPP
jgi:hypothetical protein